MEVKPSLKQENKISIYQSISFYQLFKNHHNEAFLCFLAQVPLKFPSFSENHHRFFQSRILHCVKLLGLLLHSCSQFLRINFQKLNEAISNYIILDQDVFLKTPLLHE